jgi:two-component system, NtrC family, sensor kinase
MKIGRNLKSASPESRPEPAGPAALSGELLSPLLDDFPDPILVSDGQGKLAFLNRAAKKLFHYTVSVGEPCPICSQLGPPEGEGPKTGCCLEAGESLNRRPLLLKTGLGTMVPLTVTATPIKGDPASSGCFVVLRDLAEDLLAHPELQLQIATLSSILEHFPMPFFMVDPDLKFTYFNQPMEEMTGYTRKETVGKMTCAAVFNTVQCNTEDCLLKQVMKCRQPISGQRRVVKDRHGREKQVTVSASIITDMAGRVIGGFEALRDITPIVEAENKIGMVTELTREGILMTDEHQRVVFANSRMAEITGLSKQELLGKGLGEVLSPHHLKIAVELSRLVEEGRQQELQFCSTLDQPEPRKGRRVFETCMAVSKLGEKTLSCFYLRDLTRRIKIEEELRKTNTFLNEIIRCSVDGIVVVDRKGVPLIFNEGAERILGFRAEEIIGHPETFRQFYPFALASEMMQRLRSDEYGPKDKLPATQITFYNKQGEKVPVKLSAAMIREGGREIGSVGIFTDLREHLDLRQKLEESQSQLMQAAKIASLGRLAAGVAHEINNPLAGILIYAELLHREMTEETLGRANVEEIITQTLRCKQIVNRLLEFSRQSLGQRTLFNVNEVIERVVTLISNQPIFHNIKISKDLDPELPQILGDAGQIQQVFTNLFLNAADAMGNKGRIVVTSRAAPSRQGVVITFSDTGMGMPQEIKERIFEPFFTTKAPGKGTGLGLSIVYGVIKRHGGRIEVDSSTGAGASFIINLPLDSPEGEGFFDQEDEGPGKKSAFLAPGDHSRVIG